MDISSSALVIHSRREEVVLAGPSFRFNYFANHFVLAPTYSQPLLSTMVVVVLVLVFCAIKDALDAGPWEG